MNKKLPSLLSLACFATFAHGQAFWTDNFESATSATRTPSVNTGFGAPLQTAYFKRTNGTDIDLVTNSDGAYSNFQGSFFWAGEYHNNITGAVVAGTEERQIEFTGINVSGRTNLVFKGLFASANSNAQWDNLNYIPPNTHSDYVIVEYRFGTNPYQRLIAFFGNNGVAKQFREDTNNDGLGDGALLSKSFTEFTKTIPGSGATLSLRLRAFSNASLNEEWAVDNFQLFEASALPVAFDAVSASLKNNRLQVDWTTFSETNNDHFEVQLSRDGVQFTTASKVVSKAANGTSAQPLSYSISLDAAGGSIALGLSLLSIAGLGVSRRRHRIAMIGAAMIVSIVAIGCTKDASESLTTADEKVYVRIAQVDKDGATSYSKTVSVQRSN